MDYIEDIKKEKIKKRVSFEVQSIMDCERNKDNECREGLVSFLTEDGDSEDDDNDGYYLSLKRGFDPVTDKDITAEYIEHDHEFDRRHGVGSNKEKQHFHAKKISEIFKSVVKFWAVIKSVIEQVSTYRAYSINTPRKIAGVFNKKNIQKPEDVVEKPKAKERGEVGHINYVNALRHDVEPNEGRFR